MFGRKNWMRNILGLWSTLRSILLFPFGIASWITHDPQGKLTTYDIVFDGLIKKRNPQHLTPRKRVREIRSAHNFDYSWRYTEKMGKMRKREDRKLNQLIDKLWFRTAR